MYGNIPYMEHLCYISPTKVSLICCDPWSRGDLRFLLQKNGGLDVHVSWHGGILGRASGDVVSMIWVDFAAGFHTLIGKKHAHGNSKCAAERVYTQHIF